MTAYFSYVGDLDDPDFEWDDPALATHRHINLPRRLVPSAPHESFGISILWLMREIEAGRLKGKQIDWGAWAARMTAAEIIALLGAENQYVSDLHRLDQNRQYVLVSAEA